VDDGGTPCATARDLPPGVIGQVFLRGCSAPAGLKILDRDHLVLEWFQEGTKP
jgi:hypothetical protein